MKKIIGYLCGMVLLSVVLPSFAASIQCPGSSKSVRKGSTISQVIQKCGKPKKTVRVKPQADILNYTSISVDHKKLSFSLYMKDKAVKGMRTAQGVRRTVIKCPRGMIKVGSPVQDVMAACGTPDSIDDVSQQIEKKRGRITKLVYRPRSYLPPTILTFKNDKLIRQK